MTSNSMSVDFSNSRLKEWCWVVAATILVAACATKGLGSKTVYHLTAIALISLTAWRSLEGNKKLTGGLLCVLAVANAFIPWLPQLSWPMAVCYLVLAQCFRESHSIESNGYHTIALTIVSTWLVTKIDLVTTWLTPLNAWAVTLIIFIALIFIPQQFKQRLWIVLLPASFVWVAMDLYECSRPKEITIESYQMTDVPVFPHGSVIEQLSGAKLKPKGETSGDVGIVNLIFGPSKSHSLHPMFLVEHDVLPSDEHTIIGSKSLHQRKPWEYNQLFGDEMILAAIARDGYWASNLGGSLEKKGRITLGSLRHYDEHDDHRELDFQPIIALHNNKTYIQDSDPFVDWLANGQKNVVWELTHGNKPLRLFNMFVVMLAGIALWSKKIQRNTLLLLIAAVGTVEGVNLNHSHSGEVHLVGSDGGPHELSRSAGVIRSIIESGRPVIQSSEPSTVVVVSRNKSYKFQGIEKLVILGPGSQVITDEGSIKVNDLPLGTVNDIIDARTLVYKGIKTEATLKIGDTLFIATDAPAKLNWNKWLPQF